MRDRFRLRPVVETQVLIFAKSPDSRFPVRCEPRAGTCWCFDSPARRSDERGFTLVELVTIMILVGILAVFVAPRFADRRVFDTRGAFDEVSAALRYARQQAVAQRRVVCVALTTSGVSIARALLPEQSACSATALLNPATGRDYLLQMPAGVALAASGATPALPVSIRFDPLGRPDAAAGIRINGDSSLCLSVEAETGYVHTVSCP